MVEKFLPRWLSFPPVAGPSPTIPSTSLEGPSTHPTRIIKALMGPCTFIFKPSDTSCPCTAGHCITQADGNVTGGTCENCGHPMHLHSDYVTISSPPGSSSIISYPDITPRVRTVKKLAALLNEKGVLHIRGTPSSGKTTLAGLLYDHYLHSQVPVVFMTGWFHIIDPLEHLVRQCNAAGYREVTRGNLLRQNLIFILDEAQISYADLALWLGIIKSQSGSPSGPRICLFASYGSPTSGPAEYPHGSTPVYLGPQQRVSILIPQDPGSPNVCLFYDEEEFEDGVNRLCSHPTMNLHIDSDARAYLYLMTNGHPGAVRALVSYLFETYRSSLKRKVILQITKELLVNALDDDRAVFETLRNAPVFRSFPTTKHLTVPAANVLRKVLQDREISCNLEDSGIKLCCEMGWIHSDHAAQSSSLAPDIICFLPSRLHEKYVEYFLHTIEPVAFPFHRFPSLTDLCEAVLRQFSRENLLSSVPKRPTASTFFRLLEAQFQDEWYRAFFSLVGHGVAISSEWSCAGDGRIDFRIIEPAWGIEILRDGDRLTEHCNRFLDLGAYHRWITKGFIKDWLILDCRHSSPQKYAVKGTKLWRVVFKQNYESVFVLNCDNEIIVEEFPLLN